MPDAFTDYKSVTKSYNPTRNVPERVVRPNKTTQLPSKMWRSMAISTDIASSKQRKRKTKSFNPVNVAQPHVEKHLVEVQSSHPTSTVHSITNAVTSEYCDATILGNDDAWERVHEISINYAETRESFDRKTTIVDSYFSAVIAEILENDPYPQTMAECKTCSDWNQWKDAIQSEISLLTKRQVFSQVIPTPPQVFPMGFKWVFIRERNENNEVVRYKARLVAQGFTQRPGIDFNKTYSPVMGRITFQYLISLAVQNHLSMQLMDVATAYLCGSLNSDIYMRVPKGILIPNQNANRNMYCVKLQKSQYGLKQSGRMWYNRLSEYLLQKGYSISDDCSCLFIKKSQMGFCIISVYVDGLNIISSTTNKILMRHANILRRSSS